MKINTKELIRLALISAVEHSYSFIECMPDTNVSYNYPDTEEGRESRETDRKIIQEEYGKIKQYRQLYKRRYKQKLVCCFDKR